MKKYAIAGFVILLPVIGWIGYSEWNSNAWQRYLIKLELRGQASKLGNIHAGELLIPIVKALAYAGDTKQASQVIGGLTDPFTRAQALRGVAEFHAEAGDGEKASELLVEAIWATTWIRDYEKRRYALKTITMSIAKIGEQRRAKSMMSEVIKEAERIDNHAPPNFVLETIIESYANLGESMKDPALLEEALKTVDRLRPNRDGVKHFEFLLLGKIIGSYSRLGEKMKDATLLDYAARTAERLDASRTKSESLRTIAESYARLGESMKDPALLEEAIKTAKPITDYVEKAKALSAIAKSYASAGVKLKDTALLTEVIKTARSVNQRSSAALGAIARSYASLGEAMKDPELLEEALKTAEFISDMINKASTPRAPDPKAIARTQATTGKLRKKLSELPGLSEPSGKIGAGVDKQPRWNFSEQLRRRYEEEAWLHKNIALSAVIESYIRLGDKEKARALLVKQISGPYSKTYGSPLVFESYVRLGETMKDAALLDDAVRIAEGIGTDRKDEALRAIAESHARLGETMKNIDMLKYATGVAKRIKDAKQATRARATIAESYARLGETMKDSALLEEALNTADGIGEAQTDQWSTHGKIVDSYIKLAESSNNPALLAKPFSLLASKLPDTGRDKMFGALLTSKMAITDVSRLRSLTSNYHHEMNRAFARAQILMACSRHDLWMRQRLIRDFLQRP